jgi:ribose transport system ATP-binding protein
MTEPSTPAQPVLTLRELGKSYAAPVLEHVNLDFFPGEVHALLGANGAGKSTLARIVSGLVAADRGVMTLGGSPYRPAKKSDAESRGVQIVQQELTLIPTLSIAENLFLHRLPSRWGMVRFSLLRSQATRALAAVGLGHLDPAAPAGGLGVGEQQLVEIARALARSCQVLILDEPTAALSDHQVELLFRHVARLRAGGVAIIYISHRLDEVTRIADRISVLRDGRVVASEPAHQLDMARAVRLMVGTGSREDLAGHQRQIGSVALRVERLSRGDRVRGASFELRRGEVLGIHGLVGSGRSELLRAILGADRPDSGAVFLAGSNRPRQFKSPRQAVDAGIGMVPEDRKTQGLMLSLPVRTNLTLASLFRYRGRLGWIDARKECAAGAVAGRQVELRCHTLEQPIGQLSGGNQQKVLLGRWLLREPEVMLLDEPTRGIDVAAKFTIYRLIDDLARRGKGIVVVSSEVEELMLLCDRIAVVSAGRIVETFKRGEWSREGLLAAAFRGYLGPREQERTPGP